MMQYSLKISLVVFAFLPAFLVAQSASEMTEVETVSDMALEIELTSSELPAPQLQRFHFRAMEKMEDFADMLTLLGDEKMEMELRQEVAKAALDFFQDEKIQLQWYDLNSKQTFEFQLDDFLSEKILAGSNVTIQFLNIAGTSPASCPPPSCSWQLEFLLVQKPEIGAAISTAAEMTIVLEKKEKHFGEVTKEVWEVYLGTITILPVRP